MVVSTGIDSISYTHARKHIASMLHEVSDPEIPGISIVDLGMVIDIREDGGRWIIDLAPTYSGCPAIDVIPFLVKTHLLNKVERVDVQMILTPAWSTDWISEEGKQKLHDYGIAPPHRVSDPESFGAPKACPQCGSTHTQLISPFGSTPCKAAYRCLDCMEPFDYFKCY